MFSKTPIIISAEDKINDVNFIPQLAGSAYDWADHETEGQLAVDVFQTDSELIIVATMAGTPSEKIGLHLHNDLLTIRGERRPPVPVGAQYIYEEAYWGKFSRTIVLPTEVKYEFAKAEYRNGALIITLPKRSADSQISITVIDE